MVRLGDLEFRPEQFFTEGGNYYSNAKAISDKANKILKQKMREAETTEFEPNEDGKIFVYRLVCPEEKRRKRIP